MKNAADDKNAPHPQSGSSSANENDNRLKLLPFEQNLMVENFISDVLFIVARGLALERLFFNHLHLYSDPASTFFVINTTAEDEHFFLDKLSTHNPDCPPKLITADVLGKDREVIYRSGGVQFITSRILMVDLLTDRVPFDKVGGILVYRAHELLSGFQESFCLRLFREKKKNGIIKAFTDSPLYIVGQGAIGQLQRLANLLYIRRVVILPRFHEEVKACFEENPPKLTQMSIKLEQAQRKSQACLRDIIATCVRELKQCTKDFDAESQSDALTPAATLRPTKLELDLKRRDCPMTERQQRLLNDLHTLRALFYKVEDLDPTQALNFISFLRSNVEVIENNSGWLFTQSAGTLFASIDALCSLKDPDGNRTISPPSKWPVFCTILEEINAKLVTENSDSPVLVLVSNEQLARQLIDLVKFGQRRYVWMVARKMIEPSQRESLSLAPPIQPLWNPVNIACYDAQLFEKDRLDLRTNLKIAQKEETKKARKRNKFMELKDPKQPRLDQFGIQPFARHKGAKRSSKLVAEMGAFKKRGSRAEITGATAKNQTFPLCREIVPPGMMPEDPFTEFYAEKEEAEKKQKKNEGEEDNNGQKEEEEEIILLDNDFPEILESEGEGSSNGATAKFPVRHFQRERTPPPLNRSIAGAARERANRSIHIIDEFQRTQDEAELAQQLADPDAQFFPSDFSATTFNKSLKSMLIFLELGSRYRLQTCLESLRPKNVIMYSQDIAATRAIETYKAINADEPLDLFVLMYEESSEEERYLSSIQRENDAIEALIKEQGLLMVPREFDVSRDSVSQLRRLTMPTKRADSRRTTNGDENIEEEMRQKVIVDMREFNSELPTVLYRRGVDLIAATLEVGDYILSPQICCERKSLDDLAQSLENGRLFKQVEQMTKHYKKCILLVESAEKYRSRVVRLGAFQGELSRRGRELRSLLALLIRQFPQLIILWSVSPSHSAELFEELKLDQQNPSLEEALAKKRTRPENDNGALMIDDETQIAGEMTTGAD